MEKRNESICSKRRHGADGEEHQSSSSKVARNEDPVEGMIKLERMSKDASILFSHFPEEIWLLISEKVVDSETLTNLMRASPVFRNLLLPRRVEFLFPQVWQVLGFKFENQKDEVYRLGIDKTCSDSDSEDSDLDNPHIDPRTKILTLRKVCKSWCRGVDELYENLPKRYKMQVNIKNVETSVNRVGDWMRDVTFYGGKKGGEQFMNYFDQTHFHDGGKQRNPIINRSMRMYYDNEKDGDRISGILILLKKYGLHFWHCVLKISDYFPTSTTFYTDLKELLEHLPNLKTLKVTYWPKNREWDQQSCKIKLPSEMAILQLEQKIASRPLPKLHQLEFLSLEDFPSWLFNALVSVNNHISMLEVIPDDAVPEDYDIYSVQMPNLKQLSMKYCSEAGFENLIKSPVNWSLEEIYLDLRRFFIPRSQIFSLLEDKWADTLTSVAIFTPWTTGASDDINIKVRDNGSSNTLNLPKVERFLFSTQEIYSLDFILPMKSLKVLQLELHKETLFYEHTLKLLRLIQKNQVIQFVGYFQRFHKSNLWNLFPNLKRFVLGNTHYSFNYFRVTCTREHYEKSANENLWFSA